MVSAFQEIQTIYTFGDAHQETLYKIKIAGKLVKDDYQDKNCEITIARISRKF
ncbi:conserved hypothetical protein [Hyella patelloides LEGE 07179]|uniref:Uncharacterized protein n=1 Tax=Hyella patelloides LEGE 07179 TaxID=945734 RepID=A0A563W489_9CYAN|nr:hypothetical protein [Hyella patelloides]VEP18353.1 conserved hypothetical protein [Hyella patelloides LEGE 07179]